MTGSVSARSQQAELITDSLPLVEVGTVLLVALVVGLHFRAPGAALVALLAVAVAYLTSIRLIAWIGQRLGVSVPSEVEPVIGVLLFGVVTDYAIFFLAEAVAVAGAQAATPITIAGLVLAGSFALLALMPVRPFRDLAFAMATGLIIDTFLVRTLLVPALILLVGERGGWPGRRLVPARPQAPLLPP